MATIILLAAVTFILILKGNKPVYEEIQEQDLAADTTGDINIEISVFQVLDGWGYDIHVDGKRLIHQPIIPVIPGNKVFVNEKWIVYEIK